MGSIATVMPRKPSAIFIGVDAGPRATLEPIARAWHGVLESHIYDSAEKWAWRMAEADAHLVVVGTSDSVPGRAIEAAARVAARRVAIPLASVEDYPGNYLPVEGGDADLLVVESEAAIKLVRTRLGSRCPQTIAISPARFDPMRLHSDSNRRSMHTRWLASRARDEPPALLWIGQPETEDALATLKILLPLQQAGGWRLLFRAHPRDTGYTAGAYRSIMQALGGCFTDLTDLGAAEVFAQAPRLVVTQFSSMVVEAGFHGIPSLCLLFPGAGMDCLYRKKGYRTPLVCDAGAVGLCTEPDQLQRTIQQLIEHGQVRHDTLTRFDAYFGIATTTAATSVEALKTLLFKGK